MVAWNRINTLLLLLVLFALLGVIALLAARTEGGPLDPSGAPTSTDGVRLPGTPISGPTTISAPGHYYLTRDIAISSGTAITINADDVSLDLGGFAIAGNNSIVSYGIYVGGTWRRITIHNGTIRNVTYGMHVVNAFHVRIADIVATSNGIGFWLGADAVLRDCTASENNTGVAISGPRAIIDSCQISANVAYGALVDEAADALIERSGIKGNNTNQQVPGGGIYLINSQRTTVRENDLASNAIADVWIQNGDNNVIIDNGIGCPTSILLQGTIGANNFYPVSPGAGANDPHANRAHNASC